MGTNNTRRQKTKADVNTNKKLRVMRLPSRR